MKFKAYLNKYTIRDKHYEKEPQPQTEDDYVGKSMGGFGRWQAAACAIVSLSRLIAMWNICSILFMAPATKFVCKEFENAVNSKCYDNCTEYEFSQEVFNRTLISDFQLICDKAWLANLAQTAIMFGVVVGVGLFGWVSDRFGRSKAIALSAIMDVIFMFCAAFTANYWIFIALRFFVGVGSGGIMSITAVYTLEIVGSQYRELAGTLAMIPIGISEMFVVTFAYLATTWNIFILEFSGISVVIMVLLIFLPETPRWLIANGKSYKAIDVLTKAAKFNKRSTFDITDNVDKTLQAMNLKENESQNLTYLDLFKTRALSLITMSAFTVWFVSGVSFYGLSQYITRLGSNIFIVIAILGAVQLPIVPLATVITKLYGRKAPMIFSHMIVGVATIILVCIPKVTWVSITFGMIAVLSSSINLCVLYIYVVELYPTPIRNMGFSWCSSGSKLGAMLSPFMANEDPHWAFSLIFAVLPFIGAAFCLLLPETQNRKLRDIFDE